MISIQKFSNNARESTSAGSQLGIGNQGFQQRISKVIYHINRKQGIKHFIGR